MDFDLGKLYRTVRYWEILQCERPKAHVPLAARASSRCCSLPASSRAAGCAPLPRMDSPPAVKKVEQLGSSNSFAAPDAAWPGDGWWRAYGDAQLDALIEEALRGSPDLDLAQARLHAAMAQVQGAHATRIPEVTGTASFTEEKQSYNNLIPKAGAAPGLERLRFGHGESGLGTGFLGQEPRSPRSGRIGAASCRGRSGANPPDPLDLGSLGLRRPCASLHVAGQRCRDAGYSNQDRGALPPAARFRSRDPGKCASGRGAAGRQRRATSSRSMSALACKGTRLRRCSVQVPIGASRSPVQPPSSRDPRGCRRTWRWSFSDGDPTSSRLGLVPKPPPGASIRPRRASTRA